MGVDALNVTSWTVQARVCSVLLKYGNTEEKNVVATLKLKRRNGTERDSHHGRYSSAQVPVVCDDTNAGGKYLTMAEWDDSPANMIMWKDLRETRVGLLGYILHLTLDIHHPPVPVEEHRSVGLRHKHVKPEETPVVESTYSFNESLGEIVELIDDANTAFRFDAQVATQDGSCRGWVRLEVDAHKGTPHHQPRLPPRDEEAPVRGRLNEPDNVVPVRVGVRPGHNVKTVTFYCNLWATGVMTNLGDKIFVKISTSVETSLQFPDFESTEKVPNSPGENFDMWCPSTEAVKMRDNDRKCKIELYSKSSGLFTGKEQLLGEAMIYELETDKPIFLPLFGGALQGPADRADHAMQMVKGAQRPPSTYHGTVAVIFRKAPRTPDAAMLKEIRSKRLHHSLSVKLWRGLYLKEFAGLHVRVLVQIPGSFLCVRGAGKELHDRGWDLNRNLLSFPGRVDKTGVLRFVKSHRLDLRTASGRDAEPPLSWVERGTEPRMNALIRVEGVVRHAYLYVVVVGEEDLPPKMFGRLRMQKQVSDTGESGVPRWKRMRWDQSVVDKPEGHPAGFILGSAWLTPGVVPTFTSEAISCDSERTQSVKSPIPSGPISIPEQATPEIIENLSAVRPASVLCRPVYCPLTGSHYFNQAPELPLQDHQFLAQSPEAMCECYCHIDVLTARSLEAMDDNGLADPRYEVWCEDRAYLMNGDAPASLNPTFNDRLVIPFKVELEPKMRDPSGLDKLPQPIPLPPVVFVLLDKDEEKYTTKFQVMGMMTVKHPEVFEQLESPLDLNDKHKPVWYDVHKPIATDFLATEAGGIDPMWRTKPRVLLAAGFSLIQAVNNFHPVDSGEKSDKEKDIKLGKILTKCSKMITITVDLLGLRDLSPDTVKNTRLNVLSFWPRENGSIKIPSEGDILTKLNPSFLMPPDTSEEARKFAESVKSLVRIKGLCDAKGTDDGDSDATSVATSVALDSVRGVRLRAPGYAVPVIDYLQPRVDPTDDEAKPFVLYPDITFEIRDEGSDLCYGSLSTTLPFDRPLQGGVEDMSAKTWLVSCAEEMAALSAVEADAFLKLVEPMNKAAAVEGSYSVHVDVFAARDGWLMWDKDVHTGARLNSHRLFTLADTEEDCESDGSKSDDDDDDDDVKQKGPKKILRVQKFNPFDWMFEKKSFQGLAFADTAAPTLVCCDRTNPANTMPKSWTQLFSAAITKTPQVTKKFETENTGSMRALCKENHFTAATHLAAPAPVKFKPSDHTGAPASGDPHNLAVNQHCFIRPVGHVVSDDDRDSRFLARLRMTVPWAVSRQWEESRSGDDGGATQTLNIQHTYDAIDDMSNNYVVFKFKKPAVVVWAPPECVDQFPSPGDTLFVMMLTDGSRKLHLVQVPSFDMRFKFESQWRVKKTLTSRYRTLEREIQAEAKKRAEREAKTDASQPKPLGEGEAEEEQPDSGDQDETELDASQKKKKKKVEPDGHSRPIHIPKNGFVLRLEKVRGIGYDRPQTNSWYRTVLKTTVPEVENLPESTEDDYQMVREFFLSRFQNLSRNFSPGNTDQDSYAGKIKGHVTVTEEHQEKDAQSEGRKNGEVARRKRHKELSLVQSQPIYQLWSDETVHLELYMLTARDLKLPSSVGDFDPVMKVYFNNSPQHQIQERKLTGEGLPSPTNLPIYRRFTFEVPMPGACSLRIELFDENNLRNVMVGYVQIDVEDRWFAMLSRNMRSMSNREFLRTHASPTKNLYVRRPEKHLVEGRKWKDPVAPSILPDTARKEGAVHVGPHLPPMAPNPIEGLQLLRADQDTGEDVPVGSLRFWMDMVPVDSRSDTFDLPALKTIPMVVYVTVKRVQKISIFRDIGSRNNLQVRGKMRFVDMMGYHTNTHAKTDVAKYQRADAHFNWRWKFEVKVPCQTCKLTLEIFNVNSIAVDDLVYNPKEISMDHFLDLAQDNFLNEKPALGMKTEIVVFDTWKDMDAMKLVSKKDKKSFSVLQCCLRCFWLLKRLLLPKKTEPKPCFMTVELEVLPKVAADVDPHPLERIGPAKGRVSLQEMIENPRAAAVILCGPRNIRIVVLFTVASLCFLTILLVILVLFLLSPYVDVSSSFVS
uniref:C2 domain-containing protein n=1 Tax=Noctiluca scintillans TaxID=2966 RepID=A0A7S1AHT7_NOCSC